MSSTEMRKLSKQDKSRANSIANECGADVLSDLKRLSTCHLKLLHSSSVFFSDMKDNKIDGADSLRL